MTAHWLGGLVDAVHHFWLVFEPATLQNEISPALPSPLQQQEQL
jgi:hypothetical protein